MKFEENVWSFLLFSPSVISDSLQPHGLQHVRLPGPSLVPRACSNSCSLSGWYRPTISSSLAPLHLPSIFLRIRVFSSELALHIRWSNYWNFRFRISPSKEYSGLISFKIDWFDIAVQGTLVIKQIIKCQEQCWLCKVNVIIHFCARYYSIVLHYQNLSFISLLHGHFNVCQIQHIATHYQGLSG